MNLSEMTKKELYKLAVEHDLPNRSKMTKEQLAKKLEKLLNKPEGALPQSVSSEITTVAPPKEPVRVKPPEYPIPDRYQLDTVVLLPVNPRKEYVYWEISDNTVNRFKKDFDSSEISYVLKVFCGDGETEFSESASVRVGRYGTWYFDLYVPDKILWAEIGILDNKGNYHAVTGSRKVRMPSDRISDMIDEETWMTVGEKIDDIYRLSGVNDLDSSVPGSVRIFQEVMRFLEQSVSSSDMLRKKGDEQ
jgi:hypothetical protein